MDKSELKRISDLVLFARVVQAGSISGCARILDMDRSTVSRRLKILENSLGAKLLVRSNRVVGTTEAGKRCFEVCLRLLEQLSGVSFAAAGVRGGVVRGPVSISASPDLMDSFLNAAIRLFEKSYPDINVRRQIHSPEQAVKEKLPTLRVGWDAGQPQQSLTRHLLDVPQAVYASPNVAERYAFVVQPDQLKNVPCIVSAAGGLDDTWCFFRGGQEHRVTIDTAYAADTLLAARESAIAGFGFCLLPRYLGDHFVRYGRLTKVLKKFRPQDRRVVSETSLSNLDDGNLALLRLFLEMHFSDKAAAQRSQVVGDVEPGLLLEAL